MLQKALNLAYYVHFAQVDKGNNPYFLHPAYIALQFSEEKEQIVALLHDVVEDGKVNIGVIEDEFGTEIANAIIAITKKEKEKYFDYINRVKQNEIARKVKIEDLKHNMDISRIKNVKPNDFSLLKRYEKALKILEENIKNI